MLTIWKFILNDPPPLSPPIFTHISSCGMMALCQVSLPTLKYMYIHCYVKSMFCVTQKWITFHFPLEAGILFSTRLGMKTCAAALSSSPPLERLKEKGAVSESMLSPICWFAITRCLPSLESEIPDDFSHLYDILYPQYVSVCLCTCIVTMHLRITLNLFQGIAKSAFIAKPCSGGMSIVIPTSRSSLFLSCLSRASNSCLRMGDESSPAISCFTFMTSCDRLRAVRVLTSLVPSLERVTRTRVSGYKVMCTSIVYCIIYAFTCKLTVPLVGISTTFSGLVESSL